MERFFEKYVLYRENLENISSKIKLQKGSNEFSPFTINANSHSKLRELVKAFLNSDNVGVGYTTIEKNKGEVEPKLKRKTLYLTGGSVRDHLKGRTIKNYNLVVDATPSEIRMILKHPESGFKEIKPKTDDVPEKYKNLSDMSNKNKVFYASRWDKQGKEIEITAEVNGEKFKIEPLSKGVKSKRIIPDKQESASSVEEDSKNRDFTINAMYIPLTNPDGENTELIDPHGGAHHLKNNEIVPIDFHARLKEDPMVGLRYLRMLSTVGNSDEIPEKHSEILKNKDLEDVPTHEIRKEFIKGLENPNTDTRKYLKIYKNSGVLDKIFPNASIDEMPENFRGDRWFVPAWLFRKEDPESVKEKLIKNGWSNQETNDISYLIKVYQGQNNPYVSHDMKNHHTGLSKNKIKEWKEMLKIPEIKNTKSNDIDLTF